MSSRFIQGEGYPILSWYNSSDVLLYTVSFPYVKENESSYIRQIFDSYPGTKVRQHELLGGDTGEDQPVGDKFKCIIAYDKIETTILNTILNSIISARSGYLKLQPRSDDGSTYKVIYSGEIEISTKNRWRHNFSFTFLGTDLITNLTLNIPT